METEGNSEKLPILTGGTTSNPSVERNDKAIDDVTISNSSGNANGSTSTSSTTTIVLNSTPVVATPPSNTTSPPPPPTPLQQQSSSTPRTSDGSSSIHVSSSNIVSNSTAPTVVNTNNTTQLQAEQKDLDEKTSSFEQRLKVNEWDVEAWLGLVTEAQTKPIQISRPIFERFLKQFPTAVRKRKHTLGLSHASFQHQYIRVDIGSCMLRLN
jgi:hypothetical protein